MFSARISRDVNGNKTVKITKSSFRGFSIQTNGNLPITHRTNTPNHGEILNFVNAHGTKREKYMINA